MSCEREPDDLDAYIETLSDVEQDRLIDAGIALDIAILLYHIRKQKGLTLETSAKLADLQQQAISRLTTTQNNPEVDFVSTHLAELGYSLELRAVDPDTGKEIFSVPLLTPTGKPRSRKRAAHGQTAAR